MSEILTFGQGSTGPSSKSTDTGPGRFWVSGSSHGLDKLLPIYFFLGNVVSLLCSMLQERDDYALDPLTLTFALTFDQKSKFFEMAYLAQFFT